MAGEIKRLYVPPGIYPTGADVYCRAKIQNPGEADDGYFLDDADGNFASSPADSYVTLAEIGSTTEYVLDESRQVWADRLYSVTFFSRVGGSRDHLVDLVRAENELVTESDIEVVQTGDSFSRIGLAGIGLTAVSLAATGLDAIASTATGMVEIAKAIWDRVLSSANHNINKSGGKIVRELKEVAGYEGGFIYYDSEGGSAGDEPFTNGTLENKVNNETDLLTLKATLEIDQVKITPGSTLPFTAPHEKQVYVGEAWILTLGNQSISASFFHGATDISGVCTGAIPPKFCDSTIKDVTMPPSSYHKCGFAGDFIAGSAGDFFFVGGSHSAIAGTGTPSFDYGAAIGATNFNFRGYHGGMEVKNMKTGDNLSFDGDGQIVINASCTGGTMRIAGHQKMTGAAAFIAAGGTIEDSARFDTDQLSELATQAAVLSRLASSVFGSDICASSISITDGTTLSGDVDDTKTINQTYWKIQETGKFKKKFFFTGLTQTESVINFVYRYFGTGTSNHKIKARMRNYITDTMENVTSELRDFPNSNTDRSVKIAIEGTVANYFDGVSPNITAEVEIYHESNINTDHQFWTDFATLGALEQIYVPADNTSIASILDDIISSIYGLSALKDLIDAVPTNQINVISPDNGGLNLPYGTEGLPENIVKGDKISFVRTLTGDWTSMRLFFALKLEDSEDFVLGDDKGGAAEIEVTGHTYDSGTDLTSLTVSLTTTQSNVAVDTYKAEIEARETDGSDPVTPLKFDLEVIIGLIN